MKKLKELFKNKYVRYFLWLFLVFISYFQIDIISRFVINKRDFYVRTINYVPCLFSAAWVFFICIIYMILPKKIGKISYVASILLFNLFSFTQFIHINILGRCYGINDIFSIGEGFEYFGSVFNFISKYSFLILLFSIILGVFTIIIWPNEKMNGRFKLSIIITLMLLGLCFRTSLINSLKDVVYIYDTENNTDIENIYDTYSNSTASIEVSGIYEFIYRSILLNIKESKEISKEEINEITEYLDGRNLKKENKYTGLLKGKNVIYIMLETVDPLFINNEIMPYLYNISKEGINFTNRYTPMYGVGATFNTEYTSITGTYSPTNSKGAYFYSRNDYKYSLANLFKNDGYIVNSFHMNAGSYYDRSSMHSSMGFIKYNSFLDYTNGKYLENDSDIMNYESIYKDIVPDTDQKFFSFIITYSGHMPYYDGRSLCEDLSTSKYKDKDFETKCFKTLLNDTDLFLENLVTKLDEDGKLDDTVLILFNDHIAYSYTKRVNMGGNEIYDLNKGFYLIYGGGVNGKNVDTINTTIDMVPTIANLFDLTGYNPNNYLGVDIFNEETLHIAYFSDYSWYDGNIYSRNLSNKEYYKNKNYYDYLNNYVVKQINYNNIIVMKNYYKNR